MYLYKEKMYFCCCHLSPATDRYQITLSIEARTDGNKSFIIIFFYNRGVQINLCAPRLNRRATCHLSPAINIR